MRALRPSEVAMLTERSLKIQRNVIHDILFLVAAVLNSYFCVDIVKMHERVSGQRRVFVHYPV